MEIYEKIFERLNEINMTQSELSRQTGIPTSTISDWKKKKMNPQSEKLVLICNALNLSLADLLDQEDTLMQKNDYSADEKYLVELYRNAKNSDKKRIIKYFERLESLD